MGCGMKIVVLIRVAAILLGISCINTSLRMVRSSVWQVRHVLISFDDVLSSQSQQEIEKYVRLMESEGSYNPTTLTPLLITQFSCIKDVCVQRLAYNTAEFSISAYEPCAYVNQTHVLTEHGKLFNAQLYNSNVLALCPSLDIRIKPLPEILSEQIVTGIMGALKNDCAAQYRLVLIDDHELRLYDKDMPSFCVICDAMSIPQQNTLDRCQDLKKKLLARTGTKQQKNWRADIRFHDQIVVSMEKGGEHGSSVS